MSFYQTTNASIVRFRTVPRKLVAPFEALQRVVQVQLIVGQADAATAILAPLTPEQLQNGVVIISPTAGSDTYALPSAYALQQYFGGRFAFNMAANQVNVGAGANQLNGNNDFFLINFYNLSSTIAGLVVNSDNTQSKPIAVAPAANNASMTPVLIRFSGVNSPLATINGVANAVTYTLY